MAILTFNREIGKQALTLATPIIFGQLGIMLTGIADTVMVGRLGNHVLAAANQANNAFFLVISFAMGMLFSISTLVSIKHGEGRPRTAFITYRAGLILSCILFFMVFVIMEAITRNFHWLQQVPEVTAIAPEFLRILNYSSLPMLVFIAARQYTDGLSFTRVSMWMTIGGLAVNIFLNWVLIYGNLGAPALGLNGAGYATLIARTAMALGLFIFIWKSRKLRPFRPAHSPTWKEITDEFIELLKIGLPVGFQFFAEVACFSISGLMVGGISTMQAAAHGIALNVASLTYMAISGLAQAGGILAGNAFGEHNVQKLRETGKVILGLTVVFQLFFALCFILFARSIAAAYGLTGHTVDVAVSLLMLAAVFQLADGVQVVAMNLLRGIKDVQIASGIAIFAYWCISLPLGYFLGIVMHGDAAGVWWGFTTGLFVAAAFATARFFYMLNKLQFKKTRVPKNP